jgi:hypothetical protein
MVVHARPLRALRTAWLARSTTRPSSKRTARGGRAGMAPTPAAHPSPPGRATLAGRLRPLGLGPPAPPPSRRPDPAGAPTVTRPLAQRRQRPRRRITPNTNTTTTTTISTHNHVDMAASLVGAGAVRGDATAAHPSKQPGHGQATSRARIDGNAARARGDPGTPRPGRRSGLAASMWPHNCGTYGTGRPAKTPVSTALGRRSMVRMGPPATGRPIPGWSGNAPSGEFRSCRPPQQVARGR